MISSIYITRELVDIPQLQAFCEEHNLAITAKSQISFNAIDFEITHPYDVVFFSSPRSVSYFLKKHQISSKSKIGCVGKGTALQAQRLGLTTDFIGSHSGEPSKNAKELADWLGDRRILLPISDISQRNLIEFIPSDQVETVIVYSTQFSPLTIPKQDVYIFSSPSNVESFLQCNKPPNGIIIAWGKSTENELKAHSIHSNVTLLRSEESELIGALSKLF